MLTFKHSGDIIQIETGHKYFEFSMNYFIDRFNCLCNNITNINQEDLTVKKKWLSIMLAGLIALSAPVQASAAWQKTPDQNWQWSENEILAIGWKQIDGVWYHFDAKGNMSTGWMKDGKNWYYLKADGSMKTGWLNDSGQWYYLNGNGVMATGWKTLDGKSYYLNGSGRMTTGWQQVDGKWYHMTSDGVRESGWTEVNGQRYFLDADGVMQTGVVQIDGKTYFLGENGQVLTGRLWVDGERYDFADTGEATGRKKPVPEKAFDTQGNQTQVVEEKPTQPDKEDDDNTHTGSIGGWYPDIDWNPGGNTDNGGNSGSTVNPVPEEPDGGDQGGDVDPPKTEDKIIVYEQFVGGNMDVIATWKDTEDGLQITVNGGKHLRDYFRVFMSGGCFTDPRYNGIEFTGFDLEDIFDIESSHVTPKLYYRYKGESNDRAATLTESQFANNILELTYENLDDSFTFRLKISDDKKVITWLGMSSDRIVARENNFVRMNISIRTIPDTTEAVYTEQQLRNALSKESIKTIEIRNTIELTNQLVIDRDVELMYGDLNISNDWQDGNKSFVLIQNGANVRFSNGWIRIEPEYIGEEWKYNNTLVEVINASVEFGDTKLTVGYHIPAPADMIRLENASAKLYQTTFYCYNSLYNGIKMDTIKGNVSHLTVISANFGDLAHQIISGSSESKVDLPNGFTEFTNEQGQREWTNDPSKIPS